MNWYVEVLKKYVEFNGRARRTELWMFVLINVAISFGLGVIDGLIGLGGALGAIYSLGVLLPSISVGVRRLHDTGRSGWWILIALIPILGAIVLIVFYAIEGDRGPNEYGPDPKGAPAPGTA